MHASGKFHKILTDNGAFDNADRMSDQVPGTAFPRAITNSRCAFARQHAQQAQ